MKRVFLTVLLLLVGQSVFAATAVESLQQQLDAMQTLRADFVQTVYNQSGQVIKETHGSLAVKRPGEFRWQVKKPLPQLIVAQGDKVWVYDPGLEQVTIRKLGSQISQAPSLLLTSRPNLTQHYSVMRRGDSYTLIPKKSDRNFHQVVITFNHGVISTLWVENNLGQRTMLHLLHVHMNKPIADRLFHFVPPQGIDVLNQYDSSSN